MDAERVRWRVVIAPARRVTNAHLDPEAMLAKAIAGAYPSAAKGSKHREDEIAYWRDRVRQQAIDGGEGADGGE